MIVFENVTVVVSQRIGLSGMSNRKILSEANAIVPTDRRIALLGPSSEGKKHLINLLGGLTLPRTGRISRGANVSFPVGHLGGFTPELPVRKNVEHIARLYDVDTRAFTKFVEETARLRGAFDKALALLPPVERKQLGYIVAFAIPFDAYVLTNQISRAGGRDDDVVYRLFEARSRSAGMIIPTVTEKFAREHCEMALVLTHGGKLRLFERLEDGLEVARAARARKAIEATREEPADF